MLVGTFMAIMDVFIVNVAIPTIRHDLHASFAQVEFIIAGYGLTYAVALITCGRLGDRFGRRRMFVIGLWLSSRPRLSAAWRSRRPG
jgi:MFS family permease